MSDFVHDRGDDFEKEFKYTVSGRNVARNKFQKTKKKISQLYDIIIRNAFYNVSKGVHRNKLISKYDTMFDCGVKIAIFGFVYLSLYFGLERLSQKRIL